MSHGAVHTRKLTVAPLGTMLVSCLGTCGGEFYAPIHHTRPSGQDVTYTRLCPNCTTSIALTGVAPRTPEERGVAPVKKKGGKRGRMSPVTYSRKAPFRAGAHGAIPPSPSGLSVQPDEVRWNARRMGWQAKAQDRTRPREERRLALQVLRLMWGLRLPLVEAELEGGTR